MTLIEAVEPKRDPRPTPGSMRARARVVTALHRNASGPQSRVVELRSEAPLALRRCHAKGPEPWADHLAHLARISLVASAAGPVGGDHHRLEVEVGAGSNLLLNDISATLLLPGRDGARSRTDVRIVVGAGATMIWMPEPVIAVLGCDHVNDVRIDLDEGSRLLVREEVVLGRHGEPPGHLLQSVRVRRGQRQIYRQDVELGTPVGGTAAVTAGYRTAGSLLMFDPDLAGREQESQPAIPTTTSAVMPLSSDGLLIAAVDDDSLNLRRQLSSRLMALGPPWHRENTQTI